MNNISAIFAQISRNIYKRCFLRKCPGIITWKSIDFWVMIPGNKLISGYCYSEINLFPGNDNWKSIDFRVSCPGNRYEKNKVKKTRGQKSHATVPLMLLMNTLMLLMNILSPFSLFFFLLMCRTWEAENTVRNVQ